MDYLTQYYKNRSEELQEELNQLNERNVFDGAYQLYQYLFNSHPDRLRNRVPDGSIDRPGRKPTRQPFGRPAISNKPGEARPMFPTDLDPGTDNGKNEPQWYPGPDNGGLPHGPGPYPYYYNLDGTISTMPVRPELR